MLEPSLEQLQAALTREAENAAGVQKTFIAGLMKAVESLSQFVQKQNEKNRQIFIAALSTVMEQPKVDPSLANGPLRKTIKQVLHVSQDALSRTHDNIVDRYNEQVLNRAKEVQEIKIDFDHRTTYRPR